MSRNHAVLDEIRKIVSEGEALDIRTRDRLLLTAVLDIYEQLEAMQPALAFYRAAVYLASALAASVIALLWGLLTGQVELLFK